jgi:hypothetical protein
VKSNTISQRRRHMLIAGLAGTAAAMSSAASALAGECTSMRGDAETLARFYTAEGKLVVSGRIVDAQCKPVAGATIDVLHRDPAARVTVTSDADGRFMFTTIAPGPAQPLRYSVMRAGRAPQTSELHITRAANLQRDNEGTWRTTFALALA